MPQYMLSVHTSETDAPVSEEEMEQRMARIGEIEADLRSTGSWRFSARMHDPDTATVVSKVDGQRVTSDGPYVETKEHVGGFYIVDAADLDEAIGWAERIVDALDKPIEVWPFFATDQ